MHYTIHERTFNGKEIQYVTFRHNRKISSDEALKLLARESRMSTADVVRLLYTMESFLVRQLESGNKVELKPLGIFSLSLKTKKGIPGERFRKSQIKSATMHFRPNRKTRIDISRIRFTEIVPVFQDWYDPIPHELD